jgi:release factor glutamine methyltransferase
MINSKQLFHDFISKIDLQVGRDELHSIAYRVFEKKLNLNRTEILAEKSVAVANEELVNLDYLITKINRHEPIQYILNEADFYGRKFFVDQAVLIPRPETEELVSLVVEHSKKLKAPTPKILDIGTGSGCIPITLALEIPASKVYALDKSKDALNVALTNSHALGAKVDFFELDFLSGRLPLDDLDVIVSNPPYIPIEEETSMSSNVKDFEPRMALFVENNDPLVFYSAIAKAGMNTLNSGGFVAVEINERFGSRTREVFDRAGYSNATLMKDISGKDRFVFAWKK